MKIAIVAYSDSGGAGNSAYRLFLGLKEIGADVSMFVLSKQKKDAQIRVIPVFSNAGTESVPFNIPESQHFAHSILVKSRTVFDSEYPRRDKNYEMFSDNSTQVHIHHIKEIQEADIINFHWVADTLDITHSLSELRHKKIWWTLHDMNAFTGGCHYSNGCTRFVQACGACPQLKSEDLDDITRHIHKIKHFAYSNIDFDIITPSRWLQSEAKRSSLFKRRKIHHIYYGLPLNVFSPAENTSIKARFQIAEHKKIVLFGADAFNRRKGAQYFQKFINHFETSHHEIVILTFGNLSEELVKGAKHQIISLGKIDSEHELAQIYSAADVYVLASIEDNLPNVALESLACGTPVVGFEIGGIPDMISHKIDGYLCGEISFESLSEGVNWVLNADKNQLSENSRKKAENYPLSLQAQKYVSLFSEQKAPIQRQRKQISLRTLNEFVYPKRSHNDYLLRFGKHETIDPFATELKAYQDLLAYTFIIDNIPKGSRILEVGGGNSRVLEALKHDYECWNVDKFEGLGNGPRSHFSDPKITVIKEYIGAGSDQIPDDYFDLVFSISTLEHVETTREMADAVKSDIDRILKPGGRSFHQLDFVSDSKIAHNGITDFFRQFSLLTQRAYGITAQLENISNSPDVFFMTESAYKKLWEPVTKIPYHTFGKPTSILFYWEKPAIDFKYVPVIKPAPIEIKPISLVTAVKNGEETIEETIDSILSQGYPNLQYAILDGGSNDKTVEIIKKYEKHLKFWTSKPDKGQYHAIKKGLDSLDGEIMGWLNCGDLLFPESLSKLNVFFNEYRNAHWVTGCQSILGPKGDFIGVKNYPPVLNRTDLLHQRNVQLGHFIQQESTFWTRTLWNSSGGLDCNYELAADFALWLSFSRHTGMYLYRDLLGSFRNEENQRSVTQRNKYVRETQLAIAKENKLIREGKASTYNHPTKPVFLTDRQISNGLHSTKSDSHVEVSIPKVSVIISVYNEGQGIHRKLTELTQQSLFLKNLVEIIVIDSGSPIDEFKYVESFQQIHGKSKIRYFRTAQRESVYAAWNRAFSLARGHYITNANVDDTLKPEALEVFSEYLDNHKECVLVHSDQIIQNSPEATQENKLKWNWPEFSRYALIQSTHVGSQPMWRKSAHFEVGFFDADYKIRGDQKYNLMLSRFGSFDLIDTPQGFINQREHSISMNEKLSISEHQRIVSELFFGAGLALFYGINHKIDVQEHQKLCNRFALESTSSYLENKQIIFGPDMIISILIENFLRNHSQQYLLRNAIRLMRLFHFSPQKQNGFLKKVNLSVYDTYVQSVSGNMEI